MSGNIRNLWIVSTVVLGSWFAVRSLSASEPALDDPPISMAVAAKRAELKDDSLAELIHRFAEAAKPLQHDPAR